MIVWTTNHGERDVLWHLLLLLISRLVKSILLNLIHITSSPTFRDTHSPTSAICTFPSVSLLLDCLTTTCAGESLYTTSNRDLLTSDNVSPHHHLYLVHLHPAHLTWSLGHETQNFQDWFLLQKSLGTIVYVSVWGLFQYLGCVFRHVHSDCSSEVQSRCHLML